jgi:uncharacterized protein
LIFEWDEDKAESNRHKHGVPFEEAKTVFGDPLSVTIEDLRQSRSERRYIDIGISSEERLLVVVYTERGEAMRLISSREATRAERKIYEEGSI